MPQCQCLEFSLRNLVHCSSAIGSGSTLRDDASSPASIATPEDRHRGKEIPLSLPFQAVIGQYRAGKIGSAAWDVSTGSIYSGGFIKAALVPFVLVIGLSAFAQQKDAALPSGPITTKPADLHTSQNSLDWAGVYEGVLPCADCPGVRTRLTLQRDGSYQLVTQIQGPQNAAKSVSGVFTWQPSGNAITLDEYGDGLQYSVGEGRLTLLRDSGGTSHSPAANLVLTLVAPAPESDGLAQQLERYRWTLVLATDANNQRIAGLPPGKDHPVVLSFAGSRVSIQAPCNRLVGAYQIAGANQLTVNANASTMMACDPALMQADTALSTMLVKPLQVEMTGRPSPRLRLVSPGNVTLNFIGQATPESLYGASTTVFLEISAHSVACQNPPPPNTRCLQYRERYYDEHGLVVGTPGEWRLLYENIEGYTHKEGERNVLRVKRFNRAAGPAGASSTVYVLDLMVESETVKP